MNKKEAEEIISSTFSNNFDEQRYKNFVSNLFKTYKLEDKIVEGQYIKLAYKDFLIKYKIVGNFEDREGHEIDILEVNLNKASTLERARTAQRNFVAEYLKTRNKDAALVAFISPNNKEWRLSLVKIENSLEVVNEKLKTKEEITPAKRWSFLVGKNEGSHTARSRFINMLTSDEDPNLAELEAAFDIETVTKEFFDKYTELYFRLKEHLDSLIVKDETIKKDFEEKEISTVDFAKKTLGQIVFLYFLQKKGWFGVGLDKQWGEGRKNFMREIFEEKNGNNFFNDILEPLFYKALADDRRKKNDIYEGLNCRMPFLNGGLFEPMNGYLWENTDIIIPDELFSNNHPTKEGDKGDGILDVFDRYNFTVNENEPLEKEVAVDPEMLGKVFENLLDIKDRKNKGAFYTPREIVHYMCQESLINYLYTETNNEIPRNDLELFIRKGDRIIENDKIALKRQEERIKKYGSDKYKDTTYSLLLPESVRTRAEELDSLLKNIKVVDPAVGSGAFPLGMINEIVRARKVLNVYLKSDASDYELKKHAITHSIYGVDIDPGAVEIAKLRLWLALVVDEETPHPLPNLEYKIMQGNSLISEYEGIKLFDEGIFNSEKKEMKQAKLGFGKTSSELKMEVLQDKISLFINESQRTKKQNLKKEIDILKWEFIEETLKEQGKDGKFQEIKKLRRKNIRPFFIWKLEFSDVFKEKGGFDVVIGNPPYFLYQGHSKKEIPTIKKIDKYKKAQGGKLNAYKLFLALAPSLIHVNGVNCQIFQNSFLSDSSAKKIRQFYLENQKIVKIDSFPERDDHKKRVFENVKMSVCIMISQNKKESDYIFVLNVWEDKHKEKGYSTMFNVNEIQQFDAFSQPIPLIKNDEKNIATKIYSQGEKSICCFEGELNMTFHKSYFNDNKNNPKIIKGAGVQRYFITDNLSQGRVEYLDEEKYLKDYVKSKKSLHHLQDRIVMQGITGVDDKRRLIMALLESGNYCANSCNYILTESENVRIKYILALLNSTLFNWLFKKTSTNSNVNCYEIEKFPIKKISLEDQQPFIDLIDKILTITLESDYDPKKFPIKQKELEKQIDELVYKLYGLTEEEIEIVENSLNK